MSDYVPKTNAEIRAIALDMVGNLIFTSDQCKTIEELGMVFLPIAMCDDTQRARMVEAEFDFFYEEYSKTPCLEVSTACRCSCQCAASPSQSMSG